MKVAKYMYDVVSTDCNGQVEVKSFEKYTKAYSYSLRCKECNEYAEIKHRFIGIEEEGYR